MDDTDENSGLHGAKVREAAADLRSAESEARDAAATARGAQERADDTLATRQGVADRREDIADDRDTVADERDADADVRDAQVDARVADADARIAQADASIAEAQLGLNLARGHMREARSHMATVAAREDKVAASQRLADEQIAEAASLMARAKKDSVEYERAVYHYTQLVRHRMANPLQTISGMAQTLLELPALDAGQRLEMLEAISEQASVLAQICLDPEAKTAIEESLRPRPFE